MRWRRQTTNSMSFTFIELINLINPLITLEEEYVYKRHARIADR
jgi:hypothetical protein